MRNHTILNMNLNYSPPEVLLPTVQRVKQKFTRSHLNYEIELRSQLTAWVEQHHLPAGSRVALALGSRGISNIAEVTALTVQILRGYGLSPFIVPAMGSHGGATAEGQEEVLEHLGITEDSCGAPIVSSMEVVLLGSTPSGVPVYMDHCAYHADAIIVINRVKLHTDFRGPVESGIMKMLSIGLGKQKGANTIHKIGVDQFSRLIPEVGSYVIEHAPVYCAIALIEDAFHRICRLEVMSPKDILTREPLLLSLAKECQAKIFAPTFDVLVVGEIGKDINGDGMDPNVTGRFGVPGLIGESLVQKVVALDLSEHTEGNACGIGLADMTTARAAARIDLAKTYMNVVTATVTNGARLPLILRNDRDAILTAVQTCTNVEPNEVRMVLIRNTNCLTEIVASEPLCREMSSTGLWEILSPPEPLLFDEEGNLLTIGYIC